MQYQKKVKQFALSRQQENGCPCICDEIDSNMLFVCICTCKREMNRN